MSEKETRQCPDCHVLPGEFHDRGCDVERCPRCGGQLIGCKCIYIVNGMDVDTMEQTHREIFDIGPSEKMYKVWDAAWGKKRMPWTGVWPGVAECREYGFWCCWDGPQDWPAQNIDGKGWIPCDKDHPEATEDLTRLRVECDWDVDKQKFVRR